MAFVKKTNMNLVTERFFGSVRRYQLDHFIIFNQDQLFNLLKPYIEYNNKSRIKVLNRVLNGYSGRTFGRSKS